MYLEEALAKTERILLQERAKPTVRYEVDDTAVTGGVVAGSHAPLAQSFSRLVKTLETIQTDTPRMIQEDPRQFRFTSENYNLLIAVHARLQADARTIYLERLLQRTSRDAPAACDSATRSGWSCWSGFASELPLIAEYCVRNGGKAQLLSAIAEAQNSPGTVILLRHMSQMIVLSFTVFSDADYTHLARSVKLLEDKIYAPNPVLRQGLRLAASCILEEARQAQYLYLKHELSSGLNIEVNQDKEKVQSYLQSLGFSVVLSDSLDAAERLYRGTSDRFDLKASMSHLRSFLEGLHGAAMPRLQARFGGPAPSGWGSGLTYLRSNGVLSKKEEEFVSSVYTLISDEAVHPLLAEREYARLFRNIVIEYALLFLWKIEKLGSGATP